MDINNENNNRAAKKDWTMWIVGINLVVMIIYTILFRQTEENYPMWGTAFFMMVQIVICLLTAIFFKRKAFLLSALAVLLIGFSTCWIAYSV
ncbi:hypothetical protein [Mucilaginibacter auburnensis]|uniref:Uncharacterized protein n=1 Tax=Mucilaginibacter auburnensis TaxID=1457233 RepID=A0A2H9VUX3_9SPHI|nr:hypothetical protein [Mucilaginibacter auburnensis]PJJ84616.1 hypothetical protein CLV57_1630 [Mucilaginibacter auburnensis]